MLKWIEMLFFFLPTLTPPNSDYEWNESDFI